MIIYSTCDHVLPDLIAATVSFDTWNTAPACLAVKPSPRSLLISRTLSGASFDLPFSTPRTNRALPAACWKRVFSARVQYLKLLSALSVVTPFMWSTESSDLPINANATNRCTRHSFGVLFRHKFTTRYFLDSVVFTMRSGKWTNPLPLRTDLGKRFIRPASLTSYKSSQSGIGSQFSMRSIYNTEQTVSNGLADRQAYLAKAKALFA